MIVVVIIGILAAVAIPSYQGFQARAKGAEAKVQLSAIYSAEAAYFAENSYYSIALADIGIPASTTKYYKTFGFAGTATTHNTGGDPAAGGALNAKCTTTDTVGGGGSAETTSEDTKGFKACAQINIGATSTATAGYSTKTDWNISDSKALKQSL